MDFKWDNKKNQSNLEKHGIAFELALEVFSDKNHLSVMNNKKEHGETRYITIGKIAGLYMVVVIHTDRQERIRIISARKASRKERSLYNDKIQS